MARKKSKIYVWVQEQQTAKDIESVKNKVSQRRGEEEICDAETANTTLNKKLQIDKSRAESLGDAVVAMSDDDDSSSVSSVAKTAKKENKAASDNDDSDDSDSSDSDSSSDSDASSAAAKKTKKDGKDVPAEQPTKKTLAAGKAKGGKRAQAVRPLITLDEVPSSTSDPQVLWDVEKCFRVAVDDKLKSFVVMSPQGDTNRAELLLKEVEPFKKRPSVQKLPLDKVAAEARMAAETLESWKTRAAAWKIDEATDKMELTAEKEQLQSDFEKFDKAMEKLKTYVQTVDQLKIDEKIEADQAKDRMQSLSGSMYCHLRNQGLPAGIAKAILLLSIVDTTLVFCSV